MGCFSFAQIRLADAVCYLQNSSGAQHFLDSFTRLWSLITETPKHLGSSEGLYLLELSLLESPLLDLDSLVEGLAESDVLLDSLEAPFCPAVG